VNVWDDGDSGYVEAELPGLTLDNIEVYVQGNQLTLAGTRQIPEPQGARWYRRERSQGSFSRTITLPWDIDADKVEAKFQEGVLTIRLPKSEHAKPRKVTVRAQ
jgi:HSP20 family protein